MANRYVGARYVPLIVGDWNSANTYEALSVVMYQGDSYISKVPVPANIQITNTTYWAKCADYNAQWAAFQQNWTEFQQDINDEIDTFEQNAFTMAKLADALVIVTDTGTANINAGNNNVGYQSNLTTEHNIDPTKYVPIAILQAATDKWTAVQISEWQLKKFTSSINLMLRLSRIDPDTTSAITGINVTCQMLLLKIAD